MSREWLMSQNVFAAKTRSIYLFEKREDELREITYKIIENSALFFISECDGPESVVKKQIWGGTICNVVLNDVQ
jgi:hypothetical protein